MNSIDFIIAVILLYFSIRGLFRGLIMELIVLLALFAGFFVATTYLTSGQSLLVKYVPGMPAGAAKVLAFILIFLVINIALRLLGKLLTKVATITLMQPVNRIAGFLFGGLKGVLMVSIVFIVLDFMPASGQWISPQLTAGSQLYQPMRRIAPAAYKILSTVLPGGEVWENKLQDLPGVKDKVAKDILNP